MSYSNPITDQTVHLVENENDPLIISNNQKKTNFRRHSVYNDCPTCKGSGKILKGIYFSFISLI